ncbi:MAG: GIDE domain-containing protein [bacterium]|nr:GIDE domain-containing protein [bacterium]
MNFTKNGLIIIPAIITIIIFTGWVNMFTGGNMQPITSIIIFGLGIWLFCYGFSLFNRKRLIQNIPTSKIKSLAMGLVEIQGRCFPVTDKPLIAPYSQKECVFYYFKVQEYTRGSNNHSSWQTISEGSSGMPFYVDDDSGRVLVDPTKAEIKLEPRYISSTPDGKQNILLPLSSESMKYIESFIIPGESAFVLGTAKELKNCSENYTQKVAQQVTDWYYNPEKQKEFDINRDGDIDKQEYILMKEKAEKLVVQKEFKDIPIKNDITKLSDIIITKGELEKTFIISNESEKTIVSQIGIKTTFYIWSGIIITLITLINICSFLLKAGKKP